MANAVRLQEISPPWEALPESSRLDYYAPVTASTGRATCYRCFRPLGSCLCSAIPSVDNRTPVLILQHPRERKHPFGTARLVALGLRQSEVLVDHAGCLRRNPSRLGPLTGCGLLYPHALARDISRVPAAERPRKLIVIDGTWHHARALYRELPVLHALPHFTLPAGLRSTFELRRQPAEHCLSTLEAIVYALAALEPETPDLNRLLDTFSSMQQRQLELLRSPDVSLRPGRRRKRSRPRASRAIPRALLEAYDSLVVVYTESCLDLGVPGKQALLCCAALRPATGELFFRVLDRPGASEAQLRQLGIQPGAQPDALSLEAFRTEWSAYLRPGDLLASWNASTLRLLSRALGERRSGIALKSVYYNLRRCRGSLERILNEEELSSEGPDPALPRALRRLHHARQLSEFLRRHAQAPEQVRAGAQAPEGQLPNLSRRP
jgi:DTW domain-containing protein